MAISSTDNFISTVYTVTTQGSTGQLQNVTISVAPGQQPAILYISPVESPVQTVQATQTVTTIEVNQVTGETTTVTNNLQQVTLIAAVITPQILVSVPLVATYEAVSVKTTVSG